MKRFFHADLENLRSKLLLMGNSACEVVELAVEALLQDNGDAADRAIKADDAIDRLEVEIDKEAIRYISLRAPQAVDLRILTVAMKACHDLERVGDEATGIAKRARKLSGENRPSSLLNIEEMSLQAVNLLRDSMKSFINEDVAAARAIPPRDKVIDAMNADNFSDLTAKIQKDPTQAFSAIELMFVSRSLERVADHAVNIAEEVIFMLSGEDVRHTGLRGKNQQAS